LRGLKKRLARLNLTPIFVFKPESLVNLTSLRVYSAACRPETAALAIFWGVKRGNLTY
jgi:hypothetical protein